MANKGKPNKDAPDKVLRHAKKEIAAARFRQAGGAVPSKPQGRGRRRTTRKFTRPLGMDRAFQRLNKSDAARLGASRMTAEERSERARKGWDTRKFNQANEKLQGEYRREKKSRAGKAGARTKDRQRRPASGVMRGDDPRWLEPEFRKLWGG